MSDLGSAAPSRWARLNTVIVALALTLSLVLVSLRYVDILSQRPDPWEMADWLVNYSGGFVRRGLIGTGLLALAGSSDQLVVATALLQLGILALVFGASFTLFLRTSRSPAWLMAVLSPAFLLFPFLSPEGALRKELIALLVVALLGVLICYRMWSGLVWIPLVIFAVGAFSHEIVALSLPAVLYLLWRGRVLQVWGDRQALIGGVVAGVAAVGALVAGALQSGTPGQVAEICASLTRVGMPEAMCGGSIAALGGSALDAARLVGQQFPPYFAYLPLMVLALIPMYVLRVPRSIWILAGVTCVALLPLFATGIDYGRWVFLATGLLTLAAIVEWQVSPFHERSMPEWGAVLFVCLWSLAYSGDPVQRPLVGRVLEIPLSLAGRFASQFLN